MHRLMLRPIGNEEHVCKPVVVKRKGESLWFIAMIQDILDSGMHFKLISDSHIFVEPAENVYTASEPEMIAYRALYESYRRAKDLSRRLHEYKLPPVYTRAVDARILDLQRYFTNVVIPGRLLLTTDIGYCTAVSILRVMDKGLIQVKEEFTGSVYEVHRSHLFVADDDVLAALYFLEASAKCLGEEYEAFHNLISVIPYPQLLAIYGYMRDAESFRSHALDRMQKYYRKYLSNIRPYAPSHP